jgi:hypothetical protein
MTALYGTFVRLQTMADGGVRLVLDLGCSLADIAALNLMPGAAFGLARITGESTIAPVEAKPEPKTKAGPLCVLACMFCVDPKFWEWACVANEDEAKEIILETCIVLSRKELDEDSVSEGLFHTHIRHPFCAWRDAQ